MKGHGNCKCIAVPERKDTSYTMLAMVRDVEKRYFTPRKQLQAEGRSVTLDTVVARMDTLQAKT